MKTNTCIQIAALLTGLAILVNWQSHAQPKTVDEAVKFFPFERGGGYSFPPFEPRTNTYPYTYIAGDGLQEEFGFYSRKIFNEHTAIPETLPAEQDTNGNWGPLADGLQVSVRLRQSKFVQGERVSAYMILRNASVSTNQWWRNGPPDFGYHLTLHQGTNVFTWMRPQQEHVELFSNSRSGFPVGDDPYWYVALPHAEGLAIAYLNRFFDLNQTGLYFLQVEISVPTMDGKSTTNVFSGTATFEIAPKPSQ